VFVSLLLHKYPHLDTILSLKQPSIKYGHFHKEELEF